jgi:hypothetical protein
MKEIAEEAGITIGATKSRLLRARKVLHRSIGKEQSLRRMKAQRGTDDEYLQSSGEFE